MDANLGLRIAHGDRLDEGGALALADVTDLAALMAAAGIVRDAGFGDVQTYSRKVFIPLTQLCRDSCHYCTFAKAPRELPQPYLDPDRVLEIARAGAKAALFSMA